MCMYIYIYNVIKYRSGGSAPSSDKIGTAQGTPSPPFNKGFPTIIRDFLYGQGFLCIEGNPLLKGGAPPRLSDICLKT